MRRVGVKFTSVYRGPLGGRITVLGGRRKLVFGRQPVINRYHHASRRVAQIAATPVVRVEIAHNEAASMKVHHQGERTRAVGRVYTYRQLAARSRDYPIDHGPDR